MFNKRKVLIFMVFGLVMASNVQALASTTIGVNWTELQEVMTEILDVIGVIADKLPGLFIKIGIVVLIAVMLGFVSALLKKVLTYLNIII